MGDRGRKAVISREDLGALLKQGYSQKGVADKLGIGKSAICKMVRKWNLKPKEPEKPTGKANAGTDSLNTITNLLEMNKHLTTEVMQILGELRKAKGSDKKELRKIFVEVIKELRQNTVSLADHKDVLDDRKTVIDFFEKVGQVLKSGLPGDLLKKVFADLCEIRNAYMDVPQMRRVVEVDPIEAERPIEIENSTQVEHPTEEKPLDEVSE